ncbi:MAG TPA: GNAT family N-acetyltransferase [Acidimicrobiales bacterium]|jgi:ribosomal protein S18 acetylase RimI-like enzyme|nr:GNAT family N-acetyltransferase [Acidimicrobiales bacterium]
MSGSSTTVEVVTDVTDELVSAIAALLPQLSSATPPDFDDLVQLVGHEASTLLAAYGLDRTLLGTLTLVTFPLPTGITAWIEDVVVDETARGLGVGSSLVDEAVRLARLQGAKAVNLTSRPSREAANRLYVRLGFERRETNVYRRGLNDLD